MKSQSFRLLAASLLAIVVAWPAMGESYKVDPNQSFIEFRATKKGIDWMIGRFYEFEGDMIYDPKAGPKAQSISLTIDAASLDTDNGKRDRHLRGDKFFDVDNYPIITFVSKAYEGDERGGVLSGDLTIRDITKEVAFEVKKIGEGEDSTGDYRAGFEGHYVMDRTDFGLDGYIKKVAKDIDIALRIEAVKN
ncbi:MAG: YceI family protein [Geminicoccaceae bacterium]